MNAKNGHHNVSQGSLRIRNVIASVALALSFPPIATHAQELKHVSAEGRHGVEATDHGVEAFHGPRGYHRIKRPAGVQVRPSVLDRHAYNHNYRAPHAFRIGPYRPPGRWRYRRWRYGQLLPPLYWAPSYLLSDFWLFGLDIPPIGYAWVRYGNDAILINLADGRIVQIVYDVFF